MMQRSNPEEKKRRMLRFLKRQESFSVTGSGGNLVSITMDSSFVVTKVEFKEGALPSTEVANLQKSMAEAVNIALSGVAAKKAERL